MKIRQKYNKITIESLNDLLDYLNNNKSGKKNWEVLDNEFNLILQSGEKDNNRLYCYKELEINNDKLYFGSNTFHVIDNMLKCISNKKVTGKIYYSFNDLTGQSRLCKALFSLTDFIQMSILTITTLFLIVSCSIQKLIPVAITLEIITICLIKLDIVQNSIIKILISRNKDKILTELKNNNIMKGGKQDDKV